MTPSQGSDGLGGPSKGAFGLRSIQPADQSDVEALIQAGLKERWGAAFDAGANPDLNNISANYVAAGSDVIVAESEGRIVTCGILRPESDHCGRILRMSVTVSHRRQGLGAHIVGELLRRARTKGMTKVLVLTDTPWSSAIRLYRSCGFTEVGQDETDTHFEIAP